MPDERHEQILALLVFLALWINGSFYLLVLLPFIYIRFVLRESQSLIGFNRRGLRPSMALGVFSGLFVLAVYYPIHINYIAVRAKALFSLGVALSDLVWYPIYEEISYRGFFLGVFTKKDSLFSNQNMALNLIQALMFTSVHHHYVKAGLPLLLIPIFILGFLSGLVFLRSRNIVGCFLAHAISNGIALLLGIVVVG